MICLEETSAMMMIVLVSIYLIESQNKEEIYIAFLMENYYQNSNPNFWVIKRMYWIGHKIRNEREYEYAHTVFFLLKN